MGAVLAVRHTVADDDTSATGEGRWMGVARSSVRRIAWATAAVVVTLGLTPAVAVAAPGDTGSNITPAERDEILAQHALFRAEVGEPPLVWDSTIAAGAQQWADAKQADGQFAHSSGTGLGENLAGGQVKDATMRLGTDERINYQTDPQPTGQEKKTVSHYTQIVWSSTTSVGCGFAPANKLAFGLVVCRYAPPGNFLGQFPYPPGTTLLPQPGLAPVPGAVAGTPAGGTAAGDTPAGGTAAGDTAGLFAGAVAVAVAGGTPAGGTPAGGTAAGGTAAGGTAAGGTAAGGTPGTPAGGTPTGRHRRHPRRRNTTHRHRRHPRRGGNTGRRNARRGGNTGRRNARGRHTPGGRHHDQLRERRRFGSLAVGRAGHAHLPDHRRPRRGGHARPGRERAAAGRRRDDRAGHNPTRPARRPHRSRVLPGRQHHLVELRLDRYPESAGRHGLLHRQRARHRVGSGR